MHNPDPSRLLLQEASAEDLPRIESLMQFYNYDLSEWCPVEFGVSGLYTLRPKDQYWAKPAVKPYLARVGDQLAGFAVVDDEVQGSNSNFNLGYFFLGRRYRGRGLAVDMVRQLFDRHPGQWEIYFFANNAPAAKFWPKAIAVAGGVGVEVQDTVSDALPCRLYKFSTRAL